MTGDNQGAAQLSDGDYAELLGFRDALRRFLRWSEAEARGVGLTPAQHQLLLAVRGHEGDPTVGDIADHLLSRHHSVVELVDRAERAGLIHRHADDADGRVVRVVLSADAEDRLGRLSASHLVELQRLQAGLRIGGLGG